MRITVAFKANEIPITYHFLFVSIIKNALSKANQEYYYNLYNYNEKENNKKSKNYTFYVKFDAFKLEKDKLIIEGNTYLTISSPDTEFMMYLYNGLTQIKDYNYKTYHLIKEKISRVPDKEINDNTVVCYMKSPIVIKNKQGHFITFEDSEYISELNYYANMNLKNYRGYGLKEKLNIKAINLKKSVIKEKNEKFNVIKRDNILFITGTMGAFELTGDREDLQVLYELGLGARRSQGFGFFDI